MSRLPPELVLLVLAHAYDTPTGSPDRTLLANCARVCTAWATPAQSLLFHKPPRLLLAAIPAFHAALQSTARRNTPMGPVVRSLHLSFSLQDTPHCPSTLVQLLQACPRLYELGLSTSVHEFDPITLARLKHAGQSLRALHLAYCGVQSPVLFQLLGVWPRVRFLKIGTEIAALPWRLPGETPILRRPHTHTPGGGGPVVESRPPAHVALYDLALARIPQPAVFAWLLGSTTALAVLDLHEIPGPTARHLLTLHTPRLRSLRLLHFSIDSAALLRQCTALEELVLYSLPVLVPLAPDVPPTIEHLSFRNPAHSFRNELRPILDAIEVLPRLRLVTCDTNSASLRDFVPLKKTCTERGAEVVISEVPAWVYEDPTVVSRFPRRRSVSNFRLMTS